MLGLRPEGVFVQPNEHANDEEQTATLNAGVVEPLGNTMDVYFSTSTDARLVGRVKAQPLEEESQTKVYIDISKVHMFEPGDYGDNLSLRATEEALADA